MAFGYPGGGTGGGGSRFAGSRSSSANTYALQQARGSQFYGETPAQWNAAFQKAFQNAYRANHPLAQSGAGGSPAAAAPTPAGDAAQGTAVPAAGTPPAGSPLDAQYYQNVAANQFKVNNQINSLNQQQGQDTNALQSTLAQLSYQQPRQSLGLEQGANRAGNLYSSTYGQKQGDLQYQFAGKKAGAQSNFQNQVATIASRIAELQQGIPIYNQQQQLAATERATQAAQNDPAAGQSDVLQGANMTGAGAGNTEGTPSAYGAPAPTPVAGRQSLAQQATARANAQTHPGQSKTDWNAAFRAAYNSLYRKGVR